MFAFIVIVFCSHLLLASANIKPNGTHINHWGFIKLLSRPIDHYEFNVGDNLTLEFFFVGSPPPNVHWFTNMTSILNHDSEDQDSVAMRGYSPYIKNIAAIKSKFHIPIATIHNAGQYSFMVTNGMDNYLNKTFHVTASPRNFTDPSRKIAANQQKTNNTIPYIRTWTHTILAKIGYPAILTCRTNQAPGESIEWTDSGGLDLEYFYNFKMLPSGDLLIRKVFEGYLGSYKCNVQNQYGRDTVEIFLHPSY
ncbi:zwei Ig domain protein zig-2-like [Panonychus citri]|uniref:zwei Ig domain protein zig-2-like n=1 Tax=Panonychus citri TaxID=50023 RepID=UPI0023077528|nr:zwei Ig domain protein zig-2-like [Panonychus citri]